MYGIVEMLIVILACRTFAV